MLHVNKKFRSLTEFFHNSIFRSLENSKKQMNKKPQTTLSLLHSSICSATKSLQIFSRVSFPALNITPIKLI